MQIARRLSQNAQPFGCETGVMVAVVMCIHLLSGGLKHLLFYPTQARVLVKELAKHAMQVNKKPRRVAGVLATAAVSSSAITSTVSR